MPHLKLLFCLLLHVHTLLFQYTTKQQLMKEFLIYYISTLYTCLLLTHSQSWRTLFPCHRTLNVKVLKTLSSPSFCCCSQLQPKIQNMHYYLFMYTTLCSLYTSMRIKSPCTFTLNMEANSWEPLDFGVHAKMVGLISVWHIKGPWLTAGVKENNGGWIALLCRAVHVIFNFLTCLVLTAHAAAFYK